MSKFWHNQNYTTSTRNNAQLGAEQIFIKCNRVNNLNLTIFPPKLKVLFECLQEFSCDELYSKLFQTNFYGVHFPED